jgi:transposase
MRMTDMTMPTYRVHILLATQPVDFRKEHHGLAALVQSALQDDPFTATVPRPACPLSAMQAPPAGQQVSKYADHLPL